MEEKKRPTRRKRHRSDEMIPKRHTHKFLIGCAAVLAITAAATVGVVNATTQKSTNLMPETAYAELPDYDEDGTYVQGCTVDDGNYAYVIKQKLGKKANLQRIDLRHGNSMQLHLSESAVKAIGHGNDLAYVEADSGKYLLVAPARSTHYLALLKLDGNKVTYKGKIPVSDTLVDAVQKVAVENVSGDKVTAIVGQGSNLRRVKIDLASKEKVTKGVAITGLSSVCDQSISIDKSGTAKYLYACHGGFTSSTGYVLKYELAGHKLKKTWEKPITGEPQSAVPWHGKLLVFLEGNTRWGTNHDQAFTDRIICWDR